MALVTAHDDAMPEDLTDAEAFDPEDGADAEEAYLHPGGAGAWLAGETPLWGVT